MSCFSRSGRSARFAGRPVPPPLGRIEVAIAVAMPIARRTKRRSGEAVVLAWAPMGAREMSANAIDVPLRELRGRPPCLKMLTAAEADRDGIPKRRAASAMMDFGLGKGPEPALPSPAKCSYERRQLIRRWLRIPTRLKGCSHLFMMPSFPFEGWSSAEAGWIERPATIRQRDFEGAAMVRSACVFAATLCADSGSRRIVFHEAAVPEQTVRQ